MRFFRNYFFVFFAAYFVLIATKLLFLAFYAGRYDGYGWSTLLYAVIWGYRFDFAMAAVVALAGTLFDVNRKAAAAVSALLLTSLVMLQLSDILYFEDASRHIGYEITDALNDASGLFLTAWTQHRGFTLFALAAFVPLLLGFYRCCVRRFSSVPADRYYLPKKLLLIALSVFFIRGMFNTIPLNPWQASQIGDVRLAALAQNGSYSAVFSLFNAKGRLKAPSVGTLDAAQTRKAFSEIYDDPDGYRLRPQRRNVVLFFLESWSGRNMRPYGYGVQTTPFFDAVLAKSLHPKAAVAGGHRTTEGMFATLVSFQNPLGRSVAKTQLQNFRYRSLIDLLDARGYSSAFFQGTAKETSGTGAFAQTLGFHRSYGKEDVKIRRYGTNSWGVYDQDLYAFVLDTLASMPEPFVIGINGATTHDSMLPEGIASKHFSDDPGENARLNALHFSDEALRDFVTALQKRYPNTLFVFFADHCGGGIEGNFENYLIPLAFYGKGIAPQAIDAYVSQRDIAPTVVDLVAGDYKKLMPDFAGKSLLSDTHFVADYYRNGVFGWVEGQRAVEYNPAADRVRCFDIADFRPHPIACTPRLLRFKTRDIAFTSVSQRLLFAGKTLEFHRWRYDGNITVR